MRTGDLHILAALLGVGVVLSPLARSGAHPSAVEAAPRSASPEQVQIDVLKAAPDAPPRPVVRMSPVVTEVAPDVVEGTLARFDGFADREFSLVVDALGRIGARVDGPFVVDGRATLVHVAASWCKPCVTDLPAFLTLAAHAPRALFIAAEDVAGPAGLASVIETLAGTSLAWPVGLELRADPAWAWAAWLGRESLPLTAVIDARGVLRVVVEGPLDGDAARRVAAALEAGS